MTKRDYIEQVQFLAKEVMSELIYRRDSECIYDLVNESADNVCIFYGDCHDIMGNTDNADAFEGTGCDFTGKNYEEIVQYIAYFAFGQDIIEAIDIDRVTTIISYLVERDNRDVA